MAATPVRAMFSQTKVEKILFMSVEHCGESEEQAQRKYEYAGKAQPERFCKCFRVLAQINLVLLYLFRAIVTPADWAISSCPCTRGAFRGCHPDLNKEHTMRIGILTGGGDCPGLNAVIRAVVRKGIFHYPDEFCGFLEGWRGVMEDQTTNLTLDSIAGILPRGGTILRTSRTNPAKKEGGIQRCLDT